MDYVAQNTSEELSTRSWAWRLRVVLHQLTSIKWNSRSGIRIYDVFPDVTCSPLGVLPENG